MDHLQTLIEALNPDPKTVIRRMQERVDAVVDNHELSAPFAVYKNGVTTGRMEPARRCKDGTF